MKNLIDDVSVYTEFLKHEYNLDITMHFLHEYSLKLYSPALGGLSRYNTHNAIYCTKVKSDMNRMKMCLNYQLRLIDNAPSDGSGAVEECVFGVRNYIRYLFDGSRCIGFVSVNGYGCGGEKCAEGLRPLYDMCIKTEPVPVKLLDAVIPPLCCMLETIFEKYSELELNHAVKINEKYASVLQLLSDNHNITLDELCAEFNCSRSYISHLFKKNNGNTIRHYCNTLKVNDAKELLRSTDMPVTDIAFTSGFNDFSYFINVFKRITGTTPLKWRRQNCGSEPHTSADRAEFSETEKR